MVDVYCSSIIFEDDCHGDAQAEGDEVSHYTHGICQTETTDLFNSDIRRKPCKFPAEERRKYDGQWIAFSADGRRIVASAEDIDSLEDRLAAAGQDPEKLTFERVDSASYPYVGAAELL